MKRLILILCSGLALAGATLSHAADGGTPQNAADMVTWLKTARSAGIPDMVAAYLHVKGKTPYVHASELASALEEALTVAAVHLRAARRDDVQRALATHYQNYLAAYNDLKQRNEAGFANGTTGMLAWKKDKIEKIGGMQDYANLEQEIRTILAAPAAPAHPGQPQDPTLGAALGGGIHRTISPSVLPGLIANIVHQVQERGQVTDGMVRAVLAFDDGKAQLEGALNAIPQTPALEALAQAYGLNLTRAAEGHDAGDDEEENLGAHAARGQSPLPQQHQLEQTEIPLSVARAANEQVSKIASKIDGHQIIGLTEAYLSQQNTAATGNEFLRATALFNALKDALDALLEEQNPGLADREAYDATLMAYEKLQTLNDDGFNNGGQQTMQLDMPTHYPSHLRMAPRPPSPQQHQQEEDEEEREEGNDADSVVVDALSRTGSQVSDADGNEHQAEEPITHGNRLATPEHTTEAPKDQLLSPGDLVPSKPLPVAPGKSSSDKSSTGDSQQGSSTTTSPSASPQPTPRHPSPDTPQGGDKAPSRPLPQIPGLDLPPSRPLPAIPGNQPLSPASIGHRLQDYQERLQALRNRWEDLQARR